MHFFTFPGIFSHFINLIKLYNSSPSATSSNVPPKYLFFKMFLQDNLADCTDCGGLDPPTNPQNNYKKFVSETKVTYSRCFTKTSNSVLYWSGILFSLGLGPSQNPCIKLWTKDEH